MPRVPTWVAVSVAMLAGECLLSAAEVTEEQLKAAFVYNFAKFVDWEHLPAAKEELVLGVLGEKPLAGELAALDGKVVGERRIRVMRLDGKSLAQCDMAFIGKLVAVEHALVRKCMERQRLLTISDRKGFVRAGGIIELYRRGKHIRFDVRHQSVAKKGLKVSSRLLSMAAPRERE